MTQEVFTLPVALPALATAGTAWVFQAPSSTTGGGVTITDVTYAQDAAGTVAASLLKYSSAGTPALNGTIASTGGTITAVVPKGYTIGANSFLAAGEWAVYVQTSGTPAADAYLMIHYVMGRGAA